MIVSVILGHPNPTSFNHALAAEAVVALKGNGHQVHFHDLYAEQFPPLLGVAEAARGSELDPVIRQHCEEISQADGIIIVHPNWWGMPPAILTGWIDRVIRPGIAYEFNEGDSGEGIPNGLLKVKAALVLNTGNTYPEREQKVFGDPLERIWRDCIFGLCGVHNFRRRTFSVIVTSNPEQRQAWLKETADLVRSCFPAA